MSHQDAGSPFDSLTLGFAVAASACVPESLNQYSCADLYPGRLVRLVDGGVHDNQGVDALIGLGCDFILCSDASGQMGDEDELLQRAREGAQPVHERPDEARIREGEYADLYTRAGASRMLGATSSSCI